MDAEKQFEIEPRRLTRSDVCPFLGLENDPETNFLWPQPAHYCYHAQPVQSICVEHQRLYCLGENHLECQIYHDDWSGPLPPEIRGLVGTETQERKIEKNLVWALAGLAILVIVLVISALVWQPIASAILPEITETPVYQVAQTGTAEIRNNQRASNALPEKVIIPTSKEPTPGTLMPEVTAVPTLYNRVGISSPVAQVTDTLRVTPTPLDCNDRTAYRYTIVSGPELSPAPGYVHILGTSPPVVRAGWTIRNDSLCRWRQLTLLAASDGSVTLPFLDVGDRIISAGDLATVAPLEPGAQIKILLGFFASQARVVNEEWTLLVNGHELVNQPPLVLEVDNWIITRKPAPTPTPTRRRRPPDDDNDGPPPSRSSDNRAPVL